MCARSRARKRAGRCRRKRGLVACPCDLPVPIREIELDAATLDFAAVDPDGGAMKIRTGIAIPGPELHDLHLLAADATESGSRSRRRTSAPATRVRSDCAARRRARARAPRAARRNVRAVRHRLRGSTADSHRAGVRAPAGGARLARPRVRGRCRVSSSRGARRARRYSTISSTDCPARAWENEQILRGPFPAVGKMTRFSERNFGSRATVIPSRSIVCARPRPLCSATKTTLRGSSFVATSAPKRFGGMRRPRPLRHGTAHAIVSLQDVVMAEDRRQSRRARSIGSATGNPASAGPFSFLEDEPDFRLHRAENLRGEDKGTRRARDAKMHERDEGVVIDERQPAEDGHVLHQAETDVREWLGRSVRDEPRGSFRGVGNQAGAAGQEQDNDVEDRRWNGRAPGWRGTRRRSAE